MHKNMAREIKYYELWISLNKKSQGMVPQGRQGEIDSNAFDKDKLIREWPSNIVFSMKMLREPDDIFVPGLCPWAISGRAKQIFERYDQGQVQYLPVSVIDVSDGKEIGPYWILNVLKVIEGVDYEHTRWVDPILREKDEYPSLNILQEALRREAVSGAHIFRLSIFGKSSREVYVSSVLKQSLEKEGASKQISFVHIPAY
jgi:hypothetical protein